MLEEDRGDENKCKEPGKLLDSRDDYSGRCEEDVDSPEEKNDSQESEPGKESEDAKHVFFLSVVVQYRAYTDVQKESNSPSGYLIPLTLPLT